SRLRDRTAWSLCIPRSVDLHTATRHAHGKRDRCHANAAANAVTVATDDEVLENEPATGTIQLVGTVGVARRRPRNVGLQAARFEWSKLHLAVDDVFGSDFRKEPPAHGKDLRGQTAEGEDSQ